LYFRPEFQTKQINIMNKKFLLPAIMILMLTVPAVSQDDYHAASSFISAGMTQFKDSDHSGPAFGGPSLGFGRRFTGGLGNFAAVYEYELGVAAPMNREMVGLNAHFKPVDLILGINLPVLDIDVVVGPAFRIGYNLQFIPDRQSGYDYSLTELNFGLAANIRIPAGESTVEVNLRNSFSGLLCRNEFDRDHHPYEQNLLDFLRDMHHNGRTFDRNNFNSTNLEFRFTGSPSSRLSLAYCAEYSNYRNNPDISILTQSVRIYINPGY
jgi:hypothetical protein